MTIEAASFIASLNSSLPTGTDVKAEGDNHLRLIKEVLLATFPGSDKAVRIQQARTNVASATTCDLGAVASDYVNITGTTAIESFGTVAAGTVRRIRFNAALTLTNDDNALILPSGANIVTVAGDTAMATSLGSGNWVVEAYHRKTGKALIIPSAADLSAVFLELLGPLFIGVSFEWNGSLLAMPDRFLPCDNRAVSRTTYEDLFDKIGVLHGPGNGTTTFQLPDDRGAVTAGLDDMGTAAGAAGLVTDADADIVASLLGEETHEMTVDELVAHVHEKERPDQPVTTDAGTDNFVVDNVWRSDDDAYGTAFDDTQSTGGGDPFNIMQPTRFKHKMIYTGVSSL